MHAQEKYSGYHFCLIWFAENFLNVARYMADARAHLLPWQTACDCAGRGIDGVDAVAGMAAHRRWTEGVRRAGLGADFI